uniref:Ig-like domain-containing protein n=1 Tax=Castor canadensis TaxID=51338 RepID=A0A8C0VTY1_CASCN|nr:junctional adhesion molecule-like isoform X2 [Castor canadensis]
MSSIIVGTAVVGELGASLLLGAFILDPKVESSMFCPLKLILIPVLLGYSLGLNDWSVSSPELIVHVGDTALMGCVFQSTEEKHVTKVDWMFSSGQHAEGEYVLFYYSNFSVPMGRFKNRVRLVGDVLHNDGSLLLENIQEADQGNFTCEIRIKGESKVFKKRVMVHVLPEDPKELIIHVGDSAEMGCVFQSTEEKLVTKVVWMFSSEEHDKEVIVLYSDLKFNKPMRYPQNWGRFQNRVNLVGNIFQNDGSIMLQSVKKSDRGVYTCNIHLGSLVFRKTFVLHVILEETRSTPRPEGLGRNQLVIIVGIVCATLLLLPVLILIVKRTHRNKSSVNSTANVKSLENMKKANPEKHIYSSIVTRELMEEEPSGQSEATYMIMHPVRPSLKSASNKLLDKMPAGGIPKTEQGF